MPLETRTELHLFKTKLHLSQKRARFNFSAFWSFRAYEQKCISNTTEITAVLKQRKAFIRNFYEHTE